MELLGDEELVWGAIRDLEACRLREDEKAMLRFVRKLNLDAANITAEDVAALHANGYADAAIYDAVMVCALFNFYNRWVDGGGVGDMPAEAYKQSGVRMAKNGYLR